MAAGHKVVVDGSNIATEGRSAPSLAQLDEAVRAYLGEHPAADVTVVVDATFGHRIEDSERQVFEEARAAGEMVSPPAGAIGRGDAFLLRIAEKTGATVLSNDSFQEFHGEHDWLFTTGRLIGGVPVAGVGWIFTPRSPVRGPKSRQSVQEAKREQRRRPAPTPAASRQKEKAIAQATEEATGDSAGRRRRRRGRPAPSEPLNDPLPFLTFVSAHPLGSELEGQVEEFASHGAFVQSGDVRCYIPLSAMGEPPPRAAREVLDRGETRTFVVQALDPQRRGIELALPGHAHVAGAPTDETVEAEIHGVAVPRKRASGSRHKKAQELATDLPAEAGSPDAPARPRRRPASQDPARKAARLAQKSVDAAPAAETMTPEKATTSKAASRKAVPAKKAPPAKKATSKKAAPAKKATSKKAPPTRKTTSKKAAPTKKATVKKAGSPKKNTAKKAPPAKKAGPPKKATSKKAPPAKKATAKKATAKKAGPPKKTAKAAPAKKATSKKAAPANEGTANKGAARKATGKKAAPAKKATGKKSGAAKR